MHFSLETSVDVSEASSAQIITVNDQQDILPVLLANCTYSLKAGEGTTIRYDFPALEKQIEERFIRGKARLKPYQVRSFTTLLGFYALLDFYSFIHSGYFYSTSSSPLLLRGTSNTAWILCLAQGPY